MHRLVCAGSTCCRSSGNATGWGQSAVKLTSRVFSALKNISGSFVAVEDGILSTTSHNGAFADCDTSEPAEDAVLEVDGEQSPQKTYVRVDSIPVIELDVADILPVRVAVCADRNLSSKDALQNSIEQSLPSVYSQASAEFAQNFLSTSSEFGDRTVQELVPDKLNDDDNIIFSSGARRKIRRAKHTKGNRSLATFGCV